MYYYFFKKKEYLTSTCTWVSFIYLGYLVYLSTWSTVLDGLDPNPAIIVTYQIKVFSYVSMLLLHFTNVIM